MDRAGDSVGARIRLYREAREVTRHQLATAVGVTPVVCERWESGQETPSPAQVMDVAWALDVAPVALEPGTPVGARPTPARVPAQGGNVTLLMAVVEGGDSPVVAAYAEPGPAQEAADAFNAAHGIPDWELCWQYTLTVGVVPERTGG